MAAKPLHTPTVFFVFYSAPLFSLFNHLFPNPFKSPYKPIWGVLYQSGAFSTSNQRYPFHPLPALHMKFTKYKPKNNKKSGTFH